jgi:hypothetical protein
MYYTTQELFALAERLDRDIALLEKNVNSYRVRCELSDLKAYRAYVQEGIEASIASVENQTGE